MGDELQDRVAIVTGGGSGIGRASASAMVRQGARVVVADADGDAAGSVAADLEAAGGLATAVAADIAGEEGIDAVVRSALDAYGRVDIVHANAAIQWFGNVLDCTIEQWDRTLAVNLTGVFLLARRVLPEFRRTGGGAFIATCSDCAIRTCDTAAAYIAAKSGLIGLVRSIAVDFGADGVRANLVTPGVTDTPGLRRLYSVGERTPEEGISRAAELSPLGRVGRPDDLGEVVAFLAGDRAGYITGANVMVDGGMTVTYGAD